MFKFKLEKYLKIFQLVFLLHKINSLRYLAYRFEYNQLYNFSMKAQKQILQLLQIVILWNRINHQT
jgi:succinate dehydrogenase/fumarate reductase cytochrome b subunit